VLAFFAGTSFFIAVKARSMDILVAPLVLSLSKDACMALLRRP